MTSPYHSKVRSTQSKGVTFLLRLEHGLYVIFPGLDEAKVSTVNSDLTNFVDVQRCMKILHELCICNKVKTFHL